MDTGVGGYLTDEAVDTLQLEDGLEGVREILLSVKRPAILWSVLLDGAAMTGRGCCPRKFLDGITSLCCSI